jgi:hypothetical protein
MSRAEEQLEALQHELEAELRAVKTAREAIRGIGVKNGPYADQAPKAATVAKVEDAIEQAGTPLYVSELAAKAKVSEATVFRAAAFSRKILVTRNGRRKVFDWAPRVEQARGEALAVNGD